MLYEEETLILKTQPGEVSFANVYSGNTVPMDERGRKSYGLCVNEKSKIITPELLLGTYQSIKPNRNALVAFKANFKPKVLCDVNDPVTGNSTNGNEQLNRLAQKFERRDVQNLTRDGLFHDIPLRLVVKRQPVFVPRGINEALHQILDDNERIVQLQIMSVQIPFIDERGDFVWKNEHSTIERRGDAL